MNHQHITTWLDSREPGPWTAEELEAVRQASGCHECRRAWEAAQAARALLQARSSVEAGPPAHFAAALMGSIEFPPPLAVRLWRANAPFLYAAAACLALLAVLELREEIAIRTREYSEAAIDAVSLAVVHDFAMGANDDDAINN
ncbi:MAG: hypothetical protein JST93_08860 [Acidobacteria bacterium]|nr:hypothetical protein [Acidobacteriota bacterium]